MKKLYVTQPDLPPLEEFIPFLREIWDRKILINNGPFHDNGLMVRRGAGRSTHYGLALEGWGWPPDGA